MPQLGKATASEGRLSAPATQRRRCRVLWVSAFLACTAYASAEHDADTLSSAETGTAVRVERVDARVPSEPFVLDDGSGDCGPVSFTLSYSDDPWVIFVNIETPDPASRTDLYVDAGNDLILDRPAQFTVEDELRAAQSQHADAASVADRAADGGFVQEWRIDLAALGLEAAAETPAVIGMDVEIVACDGEAVAWGEKSEKWLIDRRLTRISLVPPDLEMGHVEGRTAWRQSDGISPPARVLIRRTSDGAYERLVETDALGGFRASLPEGSYVVTTLDTRTLGSLGGTAELDIRRGETSRVGSLEARLPLGVAYDRIAADVMAEQNIRALGVVYIEGGETRWRATYGVMADGAPADATSQFKMASVAKPVAGTVALTLVEKGLWSLDEPLATYWIDPDLENDPRLRSITTRRVLTHTTGLPNHAGDKPLEFLHDPGERQSYSGEGFEYLRRAVEARFEQPFQAVAEEHLFDPAGMDSASFQGPKPGPGRYVHKFHNEYRFDPPSWHVADLKGGLMVTPADLEAFLYWMLDGAGLSADLWHEIATRNDPGLLAGDVEPFRAFGLGWIVNREGALTLSHGGSEFGARTYMVLLPEQRSALVVATNASGGGPAIRTIVEATLMQRQRLPAIDAALERAESFEW